MTDATRKVPAVSSRSALAAAKIVVVRCDGRLRPEAASLPATRLLAAMGHPGYSRAFAEAAIMRMATRGVSAWAAIRDEGYPR